MMDGQGILTYKDGRTIRGLFRKGKIINSTEINKSTIVKKPIKKSKQNSRVKTNPKSGEST